MTPEELKCILNSSEVDTSMCINKCNGMMVTSFSHTEIDKKVDVYIRKEVMAYKTYKKWFRPQASKDIEGLYLKCT